MQIIVTNSSKFSDFVFPEGCKPFILDIDQLIQENFGSYDNLTIERKWILSDLMEKRICNLIKSGKNCSLLIVKKEQKESFPQEIRDIVSSYRPELIVEIIIK